MNEKIEVLKTNEKPQEATNVEKEEVEALKSEILLKIQELENELSLKIQTLQDQSKEL